MSSPKKPRRGKKMVRGAGAAMAHRYTRGSELDEREHRRKVRTKRIAKAKAALGDHAF